MNNAPLDYDKNANPPAVLTVKVQLRRHAGRHGRVQLREGASPVPAAPSEPVGRVPRLSRLMALAIRFDDLLRKGEVKDYAELARLGHVTRARVTQIMNLLNLAPDLQEQLLFMAPVTRGRDPVKEWMVRPVMAEPAWEKQRRVMATKFRTDAIARCPP